VFILLCFSQALRFKYFQVGQSLSTASQATVANRAPHPMANAPTQQAYVPLRRRPSQTTIQFDPPKQDPPVNTNDLDVREKDIKSFGKSKFDQRAPKLDSISSDSQLPPVAAQEHTGGARKQHRTTFNPVLKSKQSTIGLGVVGRQRTKENIDLEATFGTNSTRM